MDLEGPFYINDKKYNKADLLEFANEQVASLPVGNWAYDIYRFILDFFDEQKELLQYSSGTTGEPKKFVLNRLPMYHSGMKTIQYFDLKEGDSVLLCLSEKYIAGKMMIVRALIGGLNLLTVEPSGNPLEGLDREVDFAAMVPMQVHRALEEGADFGRVRKLIVGGGSLNFEDRKKVRGLQGCEVYETFGMTETYTHIAVRRMNGEQFDDAFSVLPGVKCRIDARGCLVIDAEGISDEEIITNDMVEMSGEGGFRWLGRIDHVINSGGVKIFPEVVEEKIKEVILRELYLVGEFDEKLGEKVVLYIEGEEDRGELDVWMRELAGVLEKYEMPREFVFKEEFERTKSGKVKRMNFAAE